MINIIKVTDGEYTAWNTITHESAEIKKIYEYNPLGNGGVTYRVDKGGYTIASGVKLPEAKKVARKAVSGK